MTSKIGGMLASYHPNLLSTSWYLGPKTENLVPCIESTEKLGGLLLVPALPGGMDRTTA
jgi:hypothetical protein